MSFHALGAAAAVDADALGAALAAVVSVGAADAEGAADSMADALEAGEAAGGEPPPHASDKVGAAQAMTKATRKEEIFMGETFNSNGGRGQEFVETVYSRLDEATCMGSRNSDDVRCDVSRLLR